MKARSVIFTHTQWPLAIFGMPPRLAALAVFSGMAVYLACVVVGLIPVALIAAALCVGIGLAQAHRLGRTDRHVETVFLTTFAFWRLSSTRGLSTGAFPKQRSHTGGRS